MPTRGRSHPPPPPSRARSSAKHLRPSGLFFRSVLYCRTAFINCGILYLAYSGTFRGLVTISEECVKNPGIFRIQGIFQGKCPKIYSPGCSADSAKCDYSPVDSIKASGTSVSCGFGCTYLDDPAFLEHPGQNGFNGVGGHIQEDLADLLL